MENNFKQIIKVFINTLKIVLLPILPWILIFIILCSLLGSFVYFITVDDGTYKEEDWSNTPYAASNYTNDISVNDDGTISTSMSAQEVWDKLIENGSNVDEYLDSPEELQKLMNVQFVTQYPDIRADTTKEIDWENMDPNKQQGIIKFIRSDPDGNTKNMSYVDPVTFQSYIDDYESTGSQKAKEDALTHFTMETKKNSNANTDGDSKSNNNITDVYVKVATWTETNNVEEYTDPDFKSQNSDNTVYSMTIEEIAYQNMTKGYTMPFEFLWALLVVGEDKDFVLALADLVYGSDIEITIFDNLRVDKKEEVFKYDKKIDVKTKVSLTTKYTVKGTVKDDNYSDTYGPEEYERSKEVFEDSYKVTFIEKVSTNTLDIALTRANVWIVDYKREYKYKPGENKVTPDRQPLGLGDKISEEDKYYEHNNEDPRGFVDEIKKEIEKELNEKYKIESIDETIVNKIDSWYYKNYYNIWRTITTTENESKYISSPSTVTEKTDKEGKNGENFVTLFLDSKYKKNKANILSVPEWLFEILESNESTSEMVDLMKYLLYKATEINYGVTKYDFGIFKEENFNNVSGLKSGLSTYLRQFSHSGEAAQSADGKYYLMYGDGAGWPTIGNADLQWKSHYGKFKQSGKVLENGKEKTVDNVADYINNKYFGGNGEIRFSQNASGDAEIESKQIYIEKELVDKIGDDTQKSFYNTVLSVTSGLQLSQQQLYALTAIAANRPAYLTELINGKTFRQVYNEATALYEVNSWQHNRYIWDNWWNYLEGGLPRTYSS